MAAIYDDDSDADDFLELSLLICGDMESSKSELKRKLAQVADASGCPPPPLPQATQSMKLEEEAFTTVTTFLIDLRVFIASFWREILQPQGRVHQTTPPPPCPHLHNRTRSPHPAIFAAINKSALLQVSFQTLAYTNHIGFKHQQL